MSVNNEFHVYKFGAAGIFTLRAKIKQIYIIFHLSK